MIRETAFLTAMASSESQAEVDYALSRMLELDNRSLRNDLEDGMVVLKTVPSERVLKNIVNRNVTGFVATVAEVVPQEYLIEQILETNTSFTVLDRLSLNPNLTVKQAEKLLSVYHASLGDEVFSAANSGTLLSNLLGGTRDLKELVLNWLKTHEFLIGPKLLTVLDISATSEIFQFAVTAANRVGVDLSSFYSFRKAFAYDSAVSNETLFNYAYSYLHTSSSGSSSYSEDFITSALCLKVFTKQPGSEIFKKLPWPLLQNKLTEAHVLRPSFNTATSESAAVTWLLETEIDSFESWLSVLSNVNSEDSLRSVLLEFWPSRWLITDVDCFEGLTAQSFISQIRHRARGLYKQSWGDSSILFGYVWPNIDSLTLLMRWYPEINSTVRDSLPSLSFGLGDHPGSIWPAMIFETSLFFLKPQEAASIYQLENFDGRKLVLQASRTVPSISLVDFFEQASKSPRTISMAFNGLDMDNMVFDPEEIVSRFNDKKILEASLILFKHSRFKTSRALEVLSSVPLGSLISSRGSMPSFSLFEPATRFLFESFDNVDDFDVALKLSLSWDGTLKELVESVKALK